MTKNIMTPEDFKKRMEKIEDEQGTDLELSHLLMDDLMCKALCQLGYKGGIAIFCKSDKWYA